MDTCVEKFLDSAAELALCGPVALLRRGNRHRGATDWLRASFGGELMIDCRVAHSGASDEEIELANLPIQAGSLHTLVCLDLVRRFDETAELLSLLRSLLAPGGMILFTADIGNARPREGLSRVLTPLGLERIVADFDAALVGWQGEIDFPRRLYLVACESPAPAGFALRAGRFISAFERNAEAPDRPRHVAARMWRGLQKLFAVGSAARGGASYEAVSFLMHLPKDADWRATFFEPAASRVSPRSRLDAA